jgi:hypothetical protein
MFPMMNLSDIFGTPLTDKEIAKMDPQASALVVAVINAVSDLNECEERRNKARIDVHTKQDALAAATLAYTQPWPGPVDPLTGLPIPEGPQAAPRINPAIKQREHVAALRAVSAAQLVGYKPVPPVTNELRVAMDAASDALQKSQLLLRRYAAELHALETKAGEAIEAYRKSLPVMSRDTLMREHLARNLAERAARVAAGLPPEVPKIVPASQCEFDRVRGAGKIKPRPLMR